MARLILDYIKVVIWPSVVIIGIISFHSEIGELTKRTESVQAGVLSAKFHELRSTSTGGKETAEKVEAPEIWFDFVNMKTSHAQCLTMAENALAEKEFSGGGINNGNTAYGYQKEYVGAIWCIEPLALALVAVSGPNSKIASENVTALRRFMQSDLP